MLTCINEVGHVRGIPPQACHWHPCSQATFDSTPILHKQKASLFEQGLLLMEVRGIEPLSENPFMKVSPIRVINLTFPLPSA